MIAVAESTPLVAISLLATSIWVGGLVTIVVVARAADSALDEAQRIELFRALGRLHGIVGSVALIVALAGGVALLGDRAWDGTVWAAAIVALALVVALAVGMLQARAMTRLREAALSDPGLAPQIAIGARRAAALRGLIFLLTIVLLVLAAALI